MTRSLVLGNGNILVCLDQNARIRDFYYPFVGQENHVVGNKHRTGLWVDNKFSWLTSDEWSLSVNYKPETMISDVKAINDKLKISLKINDCVHYQENVYLRKMVVKNEAEVQREVRVFFNQHFHIAGGNIGDTVFFDPFTSALINYKGQRYFLIDGLAGKNSFDGYATGVADELRDKGTYHDATDGVLSKNPIEHGSVDSCISFNLNLKPGQSKVIHYWITVGDRYQEVKRLSEFVLKKRPEQLFKETEAYWFKWVNRQSINFVGLSDKVVELFKKSLLIIRTQTDNHGAIIASTDSDTLYFKRDTYSYMWPRDGALIARALDRSGYRNMTKKFFEFCRDIMSEKGYLLPKYLPDKSVGSSWHPWLKNGKIVLPIQEDEMALVLDALWKKYKKFGDKQWIKGLYNSFIKRAADFMVKFRNKETGLPKESYDLWEEKLGVHTFTCSTVFAGLMAASKLAGEFGSQRDAVKYLKAATEVKEGILTYLWDDEHDYFIKRFSYINDELVKDYTLDASSGYGVFEYKVLDVNDERVTHTMNAIKNQLCCKGNAKGVIRYEGDRYHKVCDLSNPWFVTTLWLAEYYIAKASCRDDMKPAIEILEWTASKAMNSGVLSEQIHPYTSQPLSVAPLTWSHAGLVIAVVKYLEKLEKLGYCKPFN